MQPLVSHFAIPVISILVTSLARLFSTFAAGFFVTSIFAVGVPELAGAAHGYPGLCDMNGKKLADGEFRQWVENKRLRVIVTYKFPAGELYEEQAQFRQQPELIQEKWSWKPRQLAFFGGKALFCSRRIHSFALICFRVKRATLQSL
jgi:hypothetical protein